MQKKVCGDHASSFFIFRQVCFNGANENNKSCGKNDRKGLTVKVNLKTRSSLLMKETIKEQGMRNKNIFAQRKKLVLKKRLTENMSKLKKFWKDPKLLGLKFENCF